MLCYDWPVSEQAKLTTDPNASNLWVVSMNQLNFNQLDAFKRKKPGCIRVVAFSPTGWTHTGGDETICVWCFICIHYLEYIYIQASVLLLGVHCRFVSRANDVVLR